MNSDITEMEIRIGNDFVDVRVPDFAHIPMQVMLNDYIEPAVALLRAVVAECRGRESSMEEE